MASVYKRKHHETINGKKIKKQSKCWYIKYRDKDGVEHRVKGLQGQDGYPAACGTA